MKKIIYFFVISLLIAACQSQKNNMHCKSKSRIINYENHIIDLLSFFDMNAYDKELGVYFSDIDNRGLIKSYRVYNVALSRLIYGLSYASKINLSNMEKAHRAADFQIDKLLTRDSIGSYFISYYDIESNSVDSSLNLDVWQQSYGLCGLTELYRIQPDDKLLNQIHKLHLNFIKRFHDPINGGFYYNYNLKKGKISGSKTLQALMYPITAYMENLWLGDSNNKNMYEPFLKENLKIAYETVWNRKLGWVNIKFDDQWNPCVPKSAEEYCSTVSPGHNFQFASLLLRTKNWCFLPNEVRQKYYELGIEILRTTLNKQIYPENDLSQGFYSDVNPVNNKIIDKRKTWWQHCEALIALSLAGTEFKCELIKLEKFYFDSFPDKFYGGEYFYLDENNVPKSKEMKGSIGKSMYHTTELIKYLSNNKI